MRFLSIFIAEIERTFILMARYPYQYFLNIVLIMIFLFAAIVPLIDKVSGFSIVDAFIGFMMWNVVLGVMQTMGWQIQSESQFGTLENIMIASGGLLKLLLARSLAGLIQSVIVIFVEAFLIFLIFKVPFAKVSPLLSLNMIMLFLLSIVGMYGFGFILGGIGIVLKRIGAIAELVNYMFLFSAGLLFPLSDAPRIIQDVGNFIPLSLGIDLMRKNYLGNGSIFQHDLAEFAIFCLQSLIYMIVGLVFFKLMIDFARKKGIIGLH